MDHAVPKRAVVQGHARSFNGSGAHHRDWDGVVPFSQDVGEERRQEMNTKEWFRAHLRWGVMVEGKEGLRCWQESIYMFLSEDHTTAFQHALKIGRREESTHTE